MDDKFKWKQKHLDKWGKMKLKYLEENNEQFLSYLMYADILYDFLKEKFEVEVDNYIESSMEQWKKNFGITVELQDDFFEYVGRRTNMHHCMDEYIYHNYVMRDITTEEWKWVIRAEEAF